jgi:Protein of unknown function (DUF3109)
MNEAAPLRIKQYTISPELYQKGYKGGAGPCSCTSTCCQHGVYVDITERDKALAHKEIIKKFMDETQSLDENQWFETGEESDPDFTSGKCASTQVVNGKCAFLDRAGRCSMQMAGTSEGKHKWDLKPIFCILFPLEISNNVIAFDDMLDEEQQCCTISDEFDTPLFEACKEELVHLIGLDGYAELETYYKENVLRSLSPRQESAA